MATEQYFQEDVEKKRPSLEKWKSDSATVDGSENNLTGGFDCNICLDLVHDPVVTLCGHLYCWPCIYKWIHCHGVSAEQQHPQCPVCKAEVSQKTLVPLYGRGQTTKPSECKVPHLGLAIPRRPPSPRCGVDSLFPATTTTSSRPIHQLHHRSYPQQPRPYSPHLGTTTTNVVHPTIGMFGEMVYSRIFGNSETTLYTSPNSYDLAGSNSPRVRRYVIQADKSLSRVCFFLFCCVVLCLLLF